MACGVFASILSSFVLFCPLSCPLFCPFALVFAFLFVLFAPAFISFPAFLGLSSWLLGFCSWSCPLSLWVVVVSFSLTDVCAKRKGAKCFCVLSCPAVCCFIWLLLYIPRTRLVSARLYRNRVLEKGNLTECSKLFCARLYSYLCSSKFVLFLFSYLLPLVGSYFLSPFRCVCPVVVALVVILSLQFCRLQLYTPCLPHCTLEHSSYTIRSQNHKSKQN